MCDCTTLKRQDLPAQPGFAPARLGRGANAPGLRQRVGKPHPLVLGSLYVLWPIPILTFGDGWPRMTTKECLQIDGKCLSRLTTTALLAEGWFSLIHGL